MIPRAEMAIKPHHISTWLECLYEQVTNEPGCATIFKEPWRIGNADESHMQMDAETTNTHILTEIGEKRVFRAKRGSREAVTLLITASADGHHFPQFIVCAGKMGEDPAKQKRIEVHHIKDAVYRFAPQGWMNQQLFAEYIAKLVEWIEKREAEFMRENPANPRQMRPFLLIMDGASAHMHLTSAQLCRRHNIILYLLPPNATKMAQPLDISYMKPLKNAWNDAVERYCFEHRRENKCVQRRNFGEAYAMAHEQMCENNIKNTIQSGFRASGIFPFDANAPFNHPELYVADKNDPRAQNLVAQMKLNQPARKFPPKSLDQPETSLIQNLAKLVNKESPSNPITGFSIVTHYKKKQKHDFATLDPQTTQEILRAQV